MFPALRLSRALSLVVVALLLISVVPHMTPRSASAAASLRALYASGSTTGGKQITLRVELTEPAPSAGKRVALTASNPAIAVPTSIKVPAGQRVHSFKVNT